MRIFLFSAGVDATEDHFGHVAKLADALALGASGETYGGSSPSVPTNNIVITNNEYSMTNFEVPYSTFDIHHSKVEGTLKWT